MLIKLAAEAQSNHLVAQVYDTHAPHNLQSHVAAQQLALRKRVRMRTRLGELRVPPHNVDCRLAEVQRGRARRRAGRRGAVAGQHGVQELGRLGHGAVPACLLGALHGGKVVLRASEGATEPGAD